MYYPLSKTLSSGDMGASLLDDPQPVTSFAEHIPSMEGFHRRYMVANMLRKMDVEMIVPQHGRFFKGKEMINAF